MANLLDELWLKVRVYTSSCAASASAEEIASYLERGEVLAGAAARQGLFPTATRSLTDAADALGKMRSAISGVQGLCRDVQAIAKIKDALVVLNNPEYMKPGSQTAARAFGQLFEGAGHFAGRLPPPANLYAPILSGCGTFFLDIQRLYDPERRPNGGQLRQVMEEMDRQFAPR